MTKQEAINKLLTYLKGENGYLEKSKKAYTKDPSIIYKKTEGAGKDNITKYWERTKKSFQGNAWCQDFVYDAFVQCFGEDNAKKLLYLDDWKVDYESWTNFACASWCENFKLHNATVQSSKTEDGNIIYFTKSHVGIVVNVDRADKKVETCEGNTSLKSGVVPNGGAVVYGKTYTLGGSNIKTYGVPNWSVLKNWNPTPEPTPTPAPQPITKPTIYKGYKDSKEGGHFCKEMQQGLNTLNIRDADGNKLTEDGSCGAKSEQAIVNFQKKYNLKVDKRFGPQCWNKLESLLKESASTSPAVIKYKVIAKALNVRKGPGINYEIKKVIKKGDIYTSTKEQNSWIYLNKIDGWASKKYLQKI